MKVFLGGTCNESTWREDLMPMLDEAKIGYFNPVVPDWTEEAYKEELVEREKCDICLYVITPKMTGVYSIAEVVDDSNKRPEKTVLGILKKSDGTSFDEGQSKSLDKVGVMVEENGGKAFESLEAITAYLEDFNRKSGDFPLFKSL